MKTILLFGAYVLVAGFVATANAQKNEIMKEGDTRTSESSDKYGAGGTHVTISDKKLKLRGDYYYDKCGRKREYVFPGNEDYAPDATYFDEDGKAVVRVKHADTGDIYYNGSGARLDSAAGKELVTKMENTKASPCPEKPGGQVKAKPEAPSLAVPPSGTPPLFGAPFSPAKSSWSGFYAGIEGNYTRSSADFSLMPTGDWNDFPDLRDELSFRGRHEFDADGGGIGGYGGYNFMFSNRVMFGLEVEGRRVWGLSDHFETGDFDFGKIGTFDVHSSFDTEDIPYLVTFGPRLGYAWGNYLPYVRGGLAFGQVDAHQGILTSNFQINPNTFGGNTNGKESTAQLGWCIGAGLEYALTDHWRLRVEYQYTDLGTLDFMGWGHPDSFHHFTSWNSVDVTEHSGNFGLGYSFGSFNRP